MWSVWSCWPSALLMLPVGKTCYKHPDREPAMLEINDRLRIPEDEFTWTFVRSGGPGGQNVNKVASKAVLRWNVVASHSLPPDVKARLLAQQRRRLTATGEIVLSS